VGRQDLRDVVVLLCAIGLVGALAALALAQL
jgi:hypothetical protein